MCIEDLLLEVMTAARRTGLGFLSKLAVAIGFGSRLTCVTRCSVLTNFRGLSRQLHSRDRGITFTASQAGELAVRRDVSLLHYRALLVKRNPRWIKHRCRDRWHECVNWRLGHLASFARIRA